nr:homeodomain-like protein [Tanacetum cinerariifolium]
MDKSLDVSIPNYPAYSPGYCLQGLLVVGDRLTDTPDNDDDDDDNPDGDDDDLDLTRGGGGGAAIYQAMAACVAGGKASGGRTVFLGPCIICALQNVGLICNLVLYNLGAKCQSVTPPNSYSGKSQGISFQSSAKSSKSEMITIGDFGRMNSAGGMKFSGSSGVVNSSSSVFSGIGNSCNSIVVDSIPELKNRGGLAVEWSVEEQYKLEEALP